jgi:hypothetical protein
MSSDSVSYIPKVFVEANPAILQLYRELATGAEQRSLPELSADEPLRALAADVLRDWAGNFPEPVTPKY